MICKQQTKNKKKTIKNIIFIQSSTLGSTLQKWLVYKKRTDLKHQLYEFLLGLSSFYAAKNLKKKYDLISDTCLNSACT